MQSSPWKANALNLAKAVGVAAAVLLWIVSAKAQRPAAEAMEQLRAILKGQNQSAAERESEVKELLERIERPSELQRALLLPEWQDKSANANIAAVDTKMRAFVARRLIKTLAQELKTGPERSQAAAKLLLEMSGGGRYLLIRQQGGLDLGSELARLVRESQPATRVIAAEALGQLNPKPDVAVPALDELLSADAVALKVVALRSLGNLVHVVSQLTTRSENAEEVLATAADVSAMARGVLPVAGRVLADKDARVRRASAAAMQQATSALCRLVAGPQLPISEMRKDEAAAVKRPDRAVILPLILDLKDYMPALVEALGDSDARVRMLARRALEDLAVTGQELAKQSARLELANHEVQGKTGKDPVEPAVHREVQDDEPLLEGLSANLSALAAGLNDPDLSARRAAIDILETMGPGAAAAAPALVEALTDGDRFVRWSAARALGKMAPTAAREAVPGLARLLADKDMGIRLAAAGALERYGPDAKEALGALTQALAAPDADTRLAALVVLDAIGPDARSATAAVTELLNDSDKRVREYAREVLGQLTTEEEGK
jgi:hypothetical protein